MQLTDKDGNVFGTGGLEITTSTGKPKIPVINTDITIGTTTIVGGVAGRLLYDNAGVVGETAGINWNPTTSTLSLLDSPFYSQAGNSSANTGFSITGTASSNYTIYSSRQFIFNTGQSMYFNTDTDGGSALDRAWYFAGARSGLTGGRTYGALTVDSSGFPSFTLYNNDNGARILLASNATSYFNGGNLLVGTTTDAGSKLQVKSSITNGTGTEAIRAYGISNYIGMHYDEGRGPVFITNYVGVGGNSPGSFNFYTSAGSVLASIGSGGVYSHNVNGKVSSGNNNGFINLWNGGSGDMELVLTTNHNITFSTNNTERLRITSTGNVLIGTTTDTGYKLDVNGVSIYRESLTNTTGGFLHKSTSTSNDAFWSIVSGSVYFIVSAGGYCKTTSNLVTEATGVGTINASAISQIDSVTKGFLPPRMSNAQMLAIATPATGLMVYDTTNNKLCCYDGTTWQNLF